MVSCTATDASGNTSSCSFTVTVNDLEPPVIICPTNIGPALTWQCARSNVTYAAAVIDNCSGATVACVPPSGSTFPKGVTTVRLYGDRFFGETPMVAVSP